MASHRTPRLSTARNRARTVTLCAATLGAAAVPVAAQAASSSAPSAIKSVKPPQSAVVQQLVAGTEKTASKTTARATFESVSSGVGNSSSSSSTSATSGETSYTVVSGDTLSGIAQRALGNGDDYHRLFRLNKDRSEPNGAKYTDVDLIDVGWTIELPAGAQSAVVSAPASSSSDSSSSSSSSSSSDSSSSAGSSDSSGASSQTASSSTSDTSATSDSSSGSSSDSGSGSSSDSGSGSSSSTDSSSSSTDYSDDLNGWIDQAISILSANGYSVSYDAVYETAMNESSGDPDAVNNSDSNAAEGNPSEGLLQTTQTTFDAYALTGYDDIWNPVDNIIAAAIYAQDTYGGLDEVVSERCGGSCWYGY